MYDAVVVGARCGGAPLAMLLARQGRKVLLVDRAAFPSDTMSTHFLLPPGVDAMRRWGLLDKLAACGAPPLRTMTWRYRDIAVAGFPANPFGLTEVYAPRRIVFDQILLDAAIAAGVEFRDRFAVRDLLRDEHGTVIGIEGETGQGTVRERAALTVGADGMRSTVARLVDAPTTRLEPTLTCQYYSYWAGVDATVVEMRPGDWEGCGALPTNDGLTTISVAWPRAGLDEFRADVEGNFHRVLRRVSPSLADRVEAGERVERMHATADIPNFIKRPYGPGWALVGDAAYHKDPLTAAGISDAFRDAGLLADALERGAPLSEYEQARDTAAKPFFEMTLQAATLAPPAGRDLEYMRALQHDQAATDQWLGAILGAIPAGPVLADENVEAVIAGAAGVLADRS